MSSLESIAREVRELVDEELKEDFSRDALGSAVCLYFALENKIESPAIDNSIHAMNSWIENMVIQRKFSRFVDREFTSALLGFYLLKKFKRLKKTIDPVTLNSLLSEYISENHFFNNLSYSLIIALSISDVKNDIKVFPDLFGWIEERLADGSLLNDAKNLVFTTMLLRRLGKKGELQKLLDSCFEKIKENDVRYQDRLYYAWVLWKNRDLRDKNDLSKIREFTEKSLENGARHLAYKETNEVSKKSYGADLRVGRPSKIYLGVYLDLLTDFPRETIRVSKEELTRVPLLTRIGDLLGLLLFGVDVIVVYYSLNLGWVRKIPGLEKATFQAFANTVAIAFLDFLLVLVWIVLATTSLSLFWDSVVKGYRSNELIIDNIKKRTKEHVKAILISGVAVSAVVDIILSLIK